MSNLTPEQMAQIAALISTFQPPTAAEPVATPSVEATPEPPAVAPVQLAVKPAPQARVQIPREQVRFDPSEWERKVTPERTAPKKKGLNILLRAWPVLLLCIPLVAWCFWSEPVKLFLIAWALVKMGVFGYFAAALDLGLNPNDQPEDLSEGITKGTASKRRQWTVIAGMICGALAP